MSAVMTRYGGMDAQVCVPTEWTDAQIIEFAEQQYPSGTDGGWHIRREGNNALGGDPERNPCLQRPGHVHIMLDP